MTNESKLYWKQSFRPRPLKFLLGGIFLGIFDNVFFHLLGVEMVLNGYSANLIVGIFFSISFGLFAWTIGVLIENRREILDYQEKLKEKEALATIGRLASGVAHEVRNPLTVIKSSASLLQEEVESPTAKKAASFILQESNRLNDFISSLLRYSRPIQLQLTEVDTATCFNQAWAITPHENCELVRRNKGDRIQVDPQTFIPVLSSILLNGCQAMKGKGSIQIETQNTENKTRISVFDEGPGISGEFQENYSHPSIPTRPKEQDWAWQWQRKSLITMVVRFTMRDNRTKAAL